MRRSDSREALRIPHPPTLAAAAIVISLAWPGAAPAAGPWYGGFGGDGGPAADAQLSFPSDVAVTADGSALIADAGNDRIREVTPDGRISTVAGDGDASAAGDGGAATAAGLNRPTGVAATADGGYVIADSANHRVRRVAADGTISTLAGGFEDPFAVAVAADGGVLVADRGADQVWRLGPGGERALVAGIGGAGFGGDGGPAVLAQLNRPSGVAATPDGFLVADTGNQRIRKVTFGVIVSVAGTGNPGFQGDGGPAVAGVLNDPVGLAVRPDGGFFLADSTGQRVRSVSAAGVISTLAGGGRIAALPGALPADAAGLGFPGGLALLPDGSLLIVGTGAHVVFRLRPDGVVERFAGRYVAEPRPVDRLALAPRTLAPPGRDAFSFTIDRSSFTMRTGGHRTLKVLYELNRDGARLNLWLARPHRGLSPRQSQLSFGHYHFCVGLPHVRPGTYRLVARATWAGQSDRDWAWVHVGRKARVVIPC